MIDATGSVVPSPKPPVLAGLGFSSSASARELIDLVEASLNEAGFSLDQLVAIATHPRKATSLVLAEVAEHFGVALRLVAGDDTGVPNPSQAVFAAVGVASVAEASAAALGVLVSGKRKSGHATCALALYQPSASAVMAASGVLASVAGS